jgi:hypothetical protein
MLLAKIFLAFMKPEVSLLCPKKLKILTYSELVEYKFKIGGFEVLTAVIVKSSASRTLIRVVR